MKLSPEVLEQGRDQIRSGDLEGLMSWVGTHAPQMSVEEVRRLFGNVLKWKDTEKALKMFDAGFVDYDAGQEARIVLFKFGYDAYVALGLPGVGIVLLIVLGALGGVVYLFRACTGL